MEQQLLNKTVTQNSFNLQSFNATLTRNEVTTIPSVGNVTQKSIKELIYNGTGFFIEDEGDTSGSLNDIQTLFLACFATLLPLVLILLAAFGIRILWTKYKRRKENAQYDGILPRDQTSDSINRPLHSHLLNDKECGETVLPISNDEVEICENVPYRSNNHSNTNGSIITMTLKNNHLIVETEERNDIEEDSRETTMKYSPSAKDGVFVVEVQQGVRRSPSSTKNEVSTLSALVHSPPERFSESNSSPKLTKTGLATSDSSLSGNRQSYCYTNQECYQSGNYGYTNYVYEESKVRPLDDDTKPKITAAVYKKNFSDRMNSEASMDFDNKPYEVEIFDERN
ncbi:unnamed protein product [Brassicogethes aeneus]|uniref:Uncharacterized protein n=1 Tax=Brassicogethes aeneus TaxID=1431903 RepID=A0A9P0BII8_BRAAE|nr:unnamed protein product [Brassicogethes aeneus]